MKCRVRATVVAVSIAVAGFPCVSRAADVHSRSCLSSGETREALQTHKLIQPFRAMVEASRGGAGESIGIKLCRLKAVMVYDVTLLRHDGHLVHVLVDAGNGALVVPVAGQ